MFWLSKSIRLVAVAALFALALPVSLLAQSSEFQTMGTVEKRSMIMCVRGYVERSFKERFEQESKADRLELGLRTYALQNGYMAMIAGDAGWMEMAAYFVREADAAAKFIRGESTSDEYQLAERAIKERLDEIIRDEQPFMDIHGDNIRKYGDVCIKVGNWVSRNALDRASE